MQHALEREPGISIVTVKNERELALYNVDDIAQKLFGSDAIRIFPIFLVFYHGHLCGFFQAVEQVVVYPALHPGALSKGIISTRQFFRIARDLIREFKRMTGNPLFMLCPKINEVSDRQLEFVRLKPIPERAFIYSEKEKS